MHLPFAWAAVAAYQDDYDPFRSKLAVTQECPNPNIAPIPGWELWRELPLLSDLDHTQSPAKEMFDHHLRAEVWANSSEKKVIIAFGGTAPKSIEDRKADFRWLSVSDNRDDEYTVLALDFAPAFVKAFRARATTADGAWLQGAELIATGHSLGGGLAQHFAYALPMDDVVPRVTKVYAFDPSPVSGKHDDEELAIRNAKGLEIYRIYNRSEVLADIRSILSWFSFSKEQGQTWIDIRYRPYWKPEDVLLTGAIAEHGMFKLACTMKEEVDGVRPPLRADSAEQCRK